MKNEEAISLHIDAAAAVAAFHSSFDNSLSTYSDLKSYEADQKEAKKLEAVLGLIDDHPEHWMLACMKVVKLKKEWSAKYEGALGSDYTCECHQCGQTVLGDDPPVVIECLPCFLKARV